MAPLKEQVYRAAAEAANNAVVAVAKYEGATTNLWSALPIGEQDILWKEARELHGEKSEEPLPKREEKKEYKELREKVLKLALTHLSAAQKEEPKTGVGSVPQRPDGPIKESDFQKESVKK